MTRKQFWTLLDDIDSAFRNNDDRLYCELRDHAIAVTDGNPEFAADARAAGLPA